MNVTTLIWFVKLLNRLKLLIHLLIGHFTIDETNRICIKRNMFQRKFILSLRRLRHRGELSFLVIVVPEVKVNRLNNTFGILGRCQSDFL